MDNRIEGKRNNAKIYILIVVYCAFIVLSYIYVQNNHATKTNIIRSSSLKKVVINTDNQTRIDYLNVDGVITTAADLGYATKIVKQKENIVTEEYYDEKEQPVQSDMKCYAVKKEYDDDGRFIRVSYLDAEGHLMINVAGYAVLLNNYDGDGRLKEEKYFGIDGLPILTYSNAYGRRYEYDNNGKAYKITYIDEEGNPMKIGVGYATVIRTFYPKDDPNNGRVKDEMYYDNEGNAISLKLGEYGAYKEYDSNGQIASITYLDEKKRPLETNRGYSSVKRTYYDDNTVATEQYYDLIGQPVSLSEGQYGIKNTEEGQRVYLDKNGAEKFNIKNTVNNFSGLVIILAICIITVSTCITPKQNYLLFVVYMIVVAYFTIMFRDTDVGINRTSLWQYKEFFTNKKASVDVIKNIWLFIPIGGILYNLYPRVKIMIIPIVISMLIEAIQLYFSIGLCEFDDIISNSLGGCIGFYLVKLTDELVQRIKSWRHIHTIKRG